MTTGVLLMTYGAPRDDADVPRYLAAVRGGRAAPDELVTEMRRRYAAIGGSPLVRITAAQACALEAELGDGWVVEAGMRFSDPTIPDAGRALVERGATQILGLVLSPQWSEMLMGGYTRALGETANAVGVPFVLAGPWYREEGFIDALAERIAEALADDGNGATILMTAHSLPKRVHEVEGDYIAQLRHTAELVASRARLAPERWRWAYQSAGHTHEEWLRPDLKELFPSLAESGHRNVLVVPVQFVADHLEVLYDLDVAAAAEARACGVRYRRIEMPNTQHAFVRALASVVRRRDRSWRLQSSFGAGSDSGTQSRPELGPRSRLPKVDSAHHDSRRRLSR